MARKISSLAEVKVYINGKEQARRDLEILTQKASDLKEQIAGSRKKITDLAEDLQKNPEKVVDYDNEKKNLIILEKEYAKLRRTIRETEKFAKDIEEDLNNLSGQSLRRLKEMQRQLDAFRNRLDPNEDKDGDYLSFLNESIKRVAETIKNKKGEIIEFSDVMDDLANIDDQSLVKVEQRLKSLMSATDKDEVDTLTRYREELKAIQDERGRRVKEEAMNVQQKVQEGKWEGTIAETQKAIELQKQYQSLLDTTDVDGLKTVEKTIAGLNQKLEEYSKQQSRETLTTGLQTAGTADIKQAVDWLTKYQGTLEPLSQEWRDINAEIEAGNARLKQLTDTTKYEAMVNQFSKLDSLSVNALAEQKKYWESMRDNAEAGTMAYDEAIDKLKEINALETSRMKQQSRETLTTGLQTAGTADIKQAVEWLTKYQGTLEPLSQEWREVNAQIEAGNARLKQLTDVTKYEAMVKQFSDLDYLSTNALAEQKKYWESMRDNAEAGTMAYDEAIDKLKEINALETSRMKQQSRETLTTGLQTAGTADIKQAVEWLTKYQGTLEPLSQEWRDVNAEIEAGNARLKQLTDQVKMEAMTAQFAKLGQLSANALAEQKKYWESIRDSLETTDPLYAQAVSNLQKIKDLVDSRTEADANQVINDVQSGNFDKTIEETQQAIKLIEEYKKTLRTQTDAPAIQRANEAIAKLNEQLGKGRQELMDYKKALQIADQVGKGIFDGTSEELNNAKKSLEEYRKTLRQKTDADKIKQVDEALKNVSHSAEIASKRIIDIDDLLDRLDTASMEELQLAAKQLQEELQNATRGTDDYIKTAAKLREVNKELKNVKKEWDGHENAVVRVTKRLAAYVAVYGGFNEILGKMKEIVKLNLQLSDSMADVQKTTGLMGVELQELGRELERIDTRTATAELYNLAAAAGQIGLKTQEDVLGFAKAANTISVALNELGAEGSATIAKIATLTGDVARSGTEQALLKVGSAINELTANSAATAGPIADFISRVGGIASSANIAIHEMAALGAATDASAQSIEIAGTSMNKFITALVSNTENIAYATNLNARELQTLINEGNTMQAVIRVFESMQTMDRGALSGAMKELGSEGARMNQYVASMVANLDMLKAQLNISREAFEENVSVINEYNVKQESAMGILQRMKNSFMDTFVNSKMTVILKDILETIASIPGWLEKNRGALFALRVLIAEIIAFRLPMLLNALMANLSGTYKLLAGPVLASLSSFKKAWMAARYEVFKANRVLGATPAVATQATRGVSGFFRTITVFVKSNWIGILIASLTAAAAAIYHFLEETDKVAKATAELTRKHTRQIEELNALRNALEATNTSYAVKAAAMREINSLYSKYLGFELEELDTYEKKKAALDYINAKLKENQTIELAARQNEVYTEEFNEETKGNVEALTESLMSIPEIGSKRLTEAMSVINETIKNGAEDASEIIAELNRHFKTDIDWKSDSLIEEGDVWDLFTTNSYEHLVSYFEKYRTLNEQLAGTDEYFNSQRIENQRISDEALERLAREHQSKIEGMIAAHQAKISELEQNGSSMSESEQIAHLQKLLKEQEDYQKTAEKMLQRAKERDEKFLSDQTDNQGIIDLGNMHAKYGGTETGHIVSARVNELNAIRKEMARIRKEQAENEKALNEASARLISEQQKKNNDEQIDEARRVVEEKKKLQDDLNKSLITEEIKWNSKYSELQTYATSDARKKWNETTEEISRNIRSLQVQISGDPWGKAFDLKDWKQFPEFIEGLEGASVTSLVQGFEKLRDNTKLITQDVDAFNKMFDLKTPLKDLEEVNTQVFRWLAQIRTELKRRDRNTTGAPIFSNAKEELDSVLNNLQTHFLKRQKEIREAYINGSMTSEEMDRKLSENDRVFVNERIELRKLLLGENSKFMKELYPDLADTDLAKLRLDLQVLGDEISDDLRKDMEEDENVVREGAIKIRKAIEKELLATDPFETLKQNFRNSLDELELMSSEFERQMADNLQISNTGEIKYDPFKLMGLDKESQQERLDFLIELSRKSYTVDKDGLREMFKSHKEYYNWVTNLDDQQMDVMLAKLQWFYDESLLKHKSYADRLIKAQESRYEQEGLKMDDTEKIQWQIDNLKEQRDNLIYAQNAAVINAAGDEQAVKEASKLNQEEIEGHTQAINRLEAKLLEEQEKAANKSKSFRSKKERETKEMMEASISALDAYYNEMEALIRKRGLERNLTEEEIERQIMDNNIARQKDMIQLRKKLLGDESTFDPFANEGYKGAITGNVFFGENRTNEALERQAQQIKVWGKALTDGMRNQIAKSEIDIQAQAQKLKEKIRDILLDRQFVQKVNDEMQKSFETIDFLNETTGEKLNFLWGDLAKNDRTQEAAEERMKILMSFQEDVYSEESESFRKRLLQDSVFGETVKNMDKEEYDAFISLLQQYHDKVLNAEKQFVDERKRIIQQQWEEDGYENGYDSAERTIGIAESNLNTMQSANAIANEQEFFDRTQELILDRVALEQWAYEQKLELYKKNNATQEMYQQLDLEHNQKQQEFQQRLLENYISRYQKMAEVTTTYGTMIGDGFGRMLAGEEDAGKQLIKNLLTETIQMASQFAQRLILQNFFGEQMQQIRATQNAKQLAAAYATAMAEVGIETNKMAAIEAIAAGEITAQSMAQPDSIVTWGGSGAARAAVIIGLVAAATAAALALVNSMFPESNVKSSSTNRRLSTGMLTYAEGNYPVLGNDGKVYDAKYEGSGMKTGIYGGGAHFGIFSEKQPEMIVDGKTTQKLILNYPYIYDAITTIAKNGRLVNAMPTFASGDYPAGMQRISQVEAVDVSEAGSQMAMIQQELAQSREINRRLLDAIEGGIVAHLDGLEYHRQQKKNQRFLEKRGID